MARVYLLLFLLIASTGWAADTKISDLTADATPTGDDLLVTVDDPAGTPANKKATITNVLAVHTGDTTDAHDASAISVDSTDLDGTGTDVQTVLEELEDQIDGKLSLTGGTLTGQLLTSNLGIEFGESDTNPTCAAGNYTIYADLSDGKLKKCQDGTPTDLDESGAGDVTAAATFGTDNSLIRADGTSKGVQATSTNATLDDDGNLTLAGSISLGGTTNPCDGSAGCIFLPQGTAPTGQGTTGIEVIAPTAVTSYRITKPGAACSGVVRWANSANVVTETCLDDTVVVQMRASGAFATGDGKDYFPIPSKLNGWNLTAVSAHVITVSSSGAINIDLARCATVATGNTCSGTVADMLSVNLTIDANESKSSTAATAATIDTGNDDVATDQVIRLDIDDDGTGAADLFVNLVFTKP